MSSQPKRKAKRTGVPKNTRSKTSQEPDQAGPNAEKQPEGKKFVSPLRIRPYAERYAEHHGRLWREIRPVGYYENMLVKLIAQSMVMVDVISEMAADTTDCADPEAEKKRCALYLKRKARIIKSFRNELCDLQRRRLEGMRDPVF